jgi:hypothetical protein
MVIAKKENRHGQYFNARDRKKDEKDMRRGRGFTPVFTYIKIIATGRVLVRERG